MLDERSDDLAMLLSNSAQLGTDQLLARTDHLTSTIRSICIKSLSDEGIPAARTLEILQKSLEGSVSLNELEGLSDRAVSALSHLMLVNQVIAISSMAKRKNDAALDVFHMLIHNSIMCGAYAARFGEDEEHIFSKGLESEIIKQKQSASGIATAEKRTLWHAEARDLYSSVRKKYPGVNKSTAIVDEILKIRRIRGASQGALLDLVRLWRREEKSKIS